MIAIVEDDPVLGAELIVSLERMGAIVHGPFRTLSAALQAFSSELPEGAILDVELLDGTVFPAADRLNDLSIPFVFYTSLASKGRSRAHHYEVPVFDKSVSSQEPIAWLVQTLGKASP
ncbi:hypothetical protein [Parvularcula maris]|uniref:Response regulator n=1 Tax=Parvularcula maris TaxID=2965077 RepID=A0A9X2LB31_9PROT|nr:hypothetical protein [Parvularcula maris]MCQ8186409.1 hypothetical protein [Parvularcula maris]